MNLRSHGPTNRVELVADIRRLERETAKARREQERLVNQERVEINMERNRPPGVEEHVVDDEVTQGNGGNQRNPPQHDPRPALVIGTYDEPNIHGNRTGICPPPVANNNFEIKASLINMVQGSKFHGFSMEDPLDHLDQFDRFCGTVKINGISEDAFKLRLFPFSLGDKAHTWEKNLAHNSITSWDQCKKVFLAKFFSTSRTARLRNEISSFTQRANESFCESWERFKGFTSQCPHHGFSKESLLSTLYRGVLPKYRMLLDTASNGNFLGQSADDGMVLVENLAQSDGNYGDDYDRTSRDGVEMNDHNRKELKALNEKIDKLLQANQRQINYVGESNGFQGCQEGRVEEQAEINFIGGQGQAYNKGFNPNYQNYQPKPQYNNSNQTYFPNTNQNYTTQPQIAPPPQAPKEDPNTTLLKQLLEGQTKGALDMNKRMDGMNAKMDGAYNELNAKFEHLASHVKSLDNQVAQVASTSSKRPMVSLPSKTECNPKDFCNVTLSSDVNDHEKDVQELSRLLYGEDGEDLVGKSEAKVEVSTREEEKVPMRFEKQDAPRDELPLYKPPLPFPGRFYTKAQKKVLSSFKASMSEIGVPLPSMDNLYQVPIYKKFIEAILENRDKVEEVMEVFKPPSSTPLAPKSIPKLKDSGIFLISCSLGDLKIDNALCDSGASVNVMSLEMMESLGIKEMNQHSSSITYGDASSKPTLGMIEDYPLKIGDCVIPTDFIIVERVKTNKLPLILGTPFLNTAGASIDFPNKRVAFLHVNPKVFYPMKPTSTLLCGTITLEEVQVEKVKNERFPLEKQTQDVEVLDDGCLGLLFEEPMEKKAMVKPPKQTHPPSLVNGLKELPPTMTLTPWRHIDGLVEYKVKFKGRSNPFASVKAILSPEFKEKGPKGVEELMKTVLTLAFKDHQWSSSTPLAPLPKVPD